METYRGEKREGRGYKVGTYNESMKNTSFK